MRALRARAWGPIMATMLSTDVYTLVLSPRDVEFCDPAFLEAVDRCLVDAGFGQRSLFVTSGYRVDRHSEHSSGMALDIRCARSSERFRLVKALLDGGFTRIGVYDRHVHVGCNPTFPQLVLWTGSSQ